MCDVFAYFRYYSSYLFLSCFRTENKTLLGQYISLHLPYKNHSQLFALLSLTFLLNFVKTLKVTEKDSWNQNKSIYKKSVIASSSPILSTFPWLRGVLRNIIMFICIRLLHKQKNKPSSAFLPPVYSFVCSIFKTLNAFCSSFAKRKWTALEEWGGGGSGCL